MPPASPARPLVSVGRPSSSQPPVSTTRPAVSVVSQHHQWHSCAVRTAMRACTSRAICSPHGHPIQACVASRATDDRATCRQRKTRRSFSTLSSCDGMSIRRKTTQVSKVGLADEVHAGRVRDTHLEAAAWWPGRDGHEFYASSICEQATDGLVISTPAPNDGC